MLRPKQLLPLYKGARAWLAAGPSCGNKNTSLDDSHGSEAPHFDDPGDKSKRFSTKAASCISEGNDCSIVSDGGIVSPVRGEASDGKPSNSSFKQRTSSTGDSIHMAHAVHAGFVDGLIQVPVSSGTFLKPPFSRSRVAGDSGVSSGVLEGSSKILPASVDGRLRQEIFTEDESGQNDLALADCLRKVGIAAAGRLSNFRDGSGFGNRGDGALFMVQGGGSTPSSSVSRRKAKSGSAGKAYSSSFTSERGALSGPSFGGPLVARTGTKFSDANKGVREFSSYSQSHDSQTELQSPLTVLNDRLNGMLISSHIYVPQTRAISDIAPGSLHGQKNRRLRELSSKEQSSTLDPAAHLEVAHDETNLPRFNGSTPGSNCSWQPKHQCHSASQGPSKSGESRRVVQESYHRNSNAGQFGGRRQVRAGASAQRGSRMDGREVVEQVCNILRQLKWGRDTEEALSRLDRKLSAYHINEVLKHQQEVGLALKFFDWAKRQDGFKHDLHTYTTMVGILGRARKFDALSVLLEDMVKDGCQPSVVTFNRLIHCYGRANHMGEALRIFHHMQEVGCKPDKVTYCTLIDLHAKAGFLDVAMDMYRQMQQAGLQPDTFTYSVIINCLGKAGELTAAHKLFTEMITRGCTPNLVTYNILIDLHAKAGKYDLALKLYNDLQDAGFRPDQVTYSIIMEVLGHVGHLEEAELVFAEMQQAGWAPDMTAYGLLVDMWGKAGNLAKACEWYSKMLDSGVMPNVPTCNSLLGTFLRANLYDAGRQVLHDMLDWDLTPSLQTYTLLLSCYTMSEKQPDCELLWNLMASTGHSAHTFLGSLPAVKPDGEHTREHIKRFFNTISCEAQESKRSFTDAVINFLHKSNMKAEAGIVWEVATEKKVYPKAVTKKAPKYWAINLHTMSMGTAIVALSRTLSNLKERMLITGVVPERIDIITGWGRRSRVTGSSLVKQAIEEILLTVSSPFHVENGNLGCFVGFGKPLADWLYESDMEQMHLI